MAKNTASKGVVLEIFPKPDIINAIVIDVIDVIVIDVIVLNKSLPSEPPRISV